ncbi:MAG: hypothetical protein LBD24_04225 [Spirochaetaceae bacterium]|nr:hypothetical protein [Spirochaetaceae bacterium]
MHYSETTSGHAEAVGDGPRLTVGDGPEAADTVLHYSETTVLCLRRRRLHYSETTRGHAEAVGDGAKRSRA